MRKMDRKDFLKEMGEKELVCSFDTGEKIYLQDFIMGYMKHMTINSFDKNSKYGVRFRNGDSMDCKKENLELVELVDEYLN